MLCLCFGSAVVVAVATCCCRVCLHPGFAPVLVVIVHDDVVIVVIVVGIRCLLCM